MSRRALLGLWGLLAVVAHVAPGWVGSWLAADPPTQSNRQLSYEIDAALDAKTREVRSVGTLTWTNPSQEPIDHVCLHLYLNAFRNERSAFMQESNASHRGHEFDPRSPGGIELTSFRRKDGPELRAKGAFVPPEVYPDDTTVLRIPLDEPIPAGGSMTFELAWTSKMPRVFARTGHALGATFFMVAQWYPKFGVWEVGSDGTTWAWNCHAFHGSSEFYADYGVYDVRLRVPPQFEGKVGATGARQGEPRKGEDGSITYAFHAEDVHDFAWVVGQDFVVHEVDFEGGAGTDPDEQAHVAQVLGRPAQDLNLPPVKLYFLLQPEHEDQLDRHVNAVKHALTLMGFWFGPYPYPTLTIVDPDHRGRDAGGMEYPTLITGGTRFVRAARQLSPEGVLVHEFGHQHFYGMVGSNEFENAWMDEGFTTYATGRVLMHAYPNSERVVWYGGLPTYGQRPLDFTNLRRSSRSALAPLATWFDKDLKIPFGSLGPIRSITKALGVNHPPQNFSLWPGEQDVSALSYLREVPTLTRWRPRPISTGEWERARDARRPVVDPIAGRKAWEYMNRGSYGANSYGRTANALRTLEGLVGEETMIRIVRTYGERYRFKHPKPEDFYALAEEIAEQPLRWFFDDVFIHGRDVDYGIESIESATLKVVRPTSRVPGEMEPGAKKPDEQAPSETAAADAPAPEPDALQRSDVVVRRFGDARLPVDVRVRFEDGSERRLRWNRDDTVVPTDGGAAPTVVNPTRDQQARWVRLRFIGKHKVSAAAADPHRLIRMDRNRANDGRRTKPHRGASTNLALRMLAWVEMTTSFYGGL